MEHAGRVVQFMLPARTDMTKHLVRKVLFLFIISLTNVAIGFADDIILLKNGDEISGKVSKISDKEVSLSVKSGGLFKQSAVEQQIPTDQIYMIKTDKRGTTFFVNGQRIIKENVKPDKSADYIYLVEGAEIPAWQLILDKGIISFQKDKAKKRAMSNIGAYPIDKVFMVRYNDGSKDIFNDLDSVSNTSKENKDAEGKTPLKVVFHDVLKGETLGSIASKYGVEVEQIKQWNEFPSQYNPGTTLKAGSQLILQVKIK